MTTIETYGTLMRSQLGVQEDPPESNRVLYSIWYGAIGPWCQMFQNWAHVKLGMVPPGFDLAAAPKGSAFTPTCADWFRKQGRWSTRPQVGALVYYDFPDDGINRISHVGWVEAVNDDGSIDAIEGNTDERGGVTGGKVMRKTRRTGIVGYGMPVYEEEDMGLSSDDKKWIADLLVGTLRAAFAAPWETDTVGAAQNQIQQLLQRADVTDDRILEAVEALAKMGPPTSAPALSGTFTFTGSGAVQSPAEGSAP
jgi:hypothetical protein